MCRLAAFPPGYPKQLAIKEMYRLLSFNKDGVGTVHVNGGRFKVVKYNGCLTDAVKKKIPLFSHMPYAGWTVAHVRAATHGDNTMENTHPFIKKDYAVVHNGVWRESYEVRMVLGDSVKFRGETDSEVAAFLLRRMKPAKFFSYMNPYGGVFLALHRNGALWAINCGGQLEIQRQKHGVLVASTIPTTKVFQLDKGFAVFSKNGTPVLIKKKKTLAYDKSDYSMACNVYGVRSLYDDFDQSEFDEYEYFTAKGMIPPFNSKDKYKDV